MSVQFPAFRGTVAEQMADYRARIAERIKVELARRGEGPNDLAYAVGVDKRTVERWEAAERQPQGRHLKAVADYFGIGIEEFRPDLELEEKAFRAQIDRIEEKLDEVLRRLSERGEGEGGTPLSAPPPKPRPKEPNRPNTGAPRKRRAGSG